MLGWYISASLHGRFHLFFFCWFKWKIALSCWIAIIWTLCVLFVSSMELKNPRLPDTRFTLAIRGTQEEVKIMLKVEKIELLTSHWSYAGRLSWSPAAPGGCHSKASSLSWAQMYWELSINFTMTQPLHFQSLWSITHTHTPSHTQIDI